MSFWKWSRTAATNSSADGSINWAEGQPPSSVNDSARAMMAAAAKYRDDIAGAIATGGTLSAYTVASYQSFDTLAHMDGAMIAFTPHTTNGATVTLNVDSLGAKPLRPAPSVELQTGALVQGTPYVATYNNSDAVWYLQGGAYNSYSIPLGGMLPYIPPNSAPNSAFAFPYGQAISRATYATLFTLVGTQYGVGDGSTTFNLPDLRGRVWAGLDNMGGSSAARLSTAMTSTTAGSVGGAQQTTLVTNNLPAYTPVGSITGSASVGVALNGYPNASLSTTGGATPFGSTLNATYPSGTLSNVVYPINNGSLAVSMNAQGGSSLAFNSIPPTIVGNFIVRII